MPDLSNSELDDLFREGADLQEFSYNEAAWADVDQRLDRQERKRKGLLFFFSLLGILALASLIWFVYPVNQNQASIAVETVANQSKIENKETSLVSAEDVDTKYNETSHQLLDKSKETTAINSSKAIVENFNEQVTDRYSNTIEKAIDSTSDAKNVNNYTKNNNSTDESANQIVIVDNIVSESTNTVEDSEEVEILNEKTVDTRKSEIESILDRAHLNELIYAIQMSTLHVPNKPLKARSTHGLIVALAGSTEWSSVEMEPVGKMGYKVEAKVGYQFGKRFELSTGVAYAKKMFQTGGETFQADEMIWTDAIVPETMYGEDDVIEIPFDLTYYHRGYNNSGIFGNIGIRSYMMHEESFNFVYSPLETRPDLIKNYTMIEEHEHWLGILRFSAGYQYRLGNYNAIQISPYVQVPITGIGHGNQRLYSAGIQIASRFNMR